MPWETCAECSIIIHCALCFILGLIPVSSFSPFLSCKLLNGFKNDFNFFVNSAHYIGKADKCECDYKASMKVQYVVNRRYRRQKGMVQNQYICLIMTVRVFTYYNGNERMC